MANANTHTSQAGTCLMVRVERQRRGWSLTKVSALTGIAQSDVSQIERGRLFAYPGWRRRIAAAFGLPEQYLFAPANAEQEAAAR